MEDSNLTSESTLRRIFICVVEYGRPVIGCGLHVSPRETVCRKAAVNKVVPRIEIRPWSNMLQGFLFYIKEVRVMDRIRISDITMKQSGKGFTLSFKEKLELSKLLDKLGVSVIELEGIEQTKIDSLRIKSIATAVKRSIVAVPVDLYPAGCGMVGGKSLSVF